VIPSQPLIFKVDGLRSYIVFNPAAAGGGAGFWAALMT
jgi:hypothetical protein